MIRVSGRPLGVCLVVAVIIAEGLVLVGAAFDLRIAAPGEWVAIVTSAGLGSLLLFKAYRLWCLHRTAWFMVLLASAVGGITHTLEIARGHAEPATWLAAGWAAASIVYLLHPAVRVLFASNTEVGGTPDY